MSVVESFRCSMCGGRFARDVQSTVRCISGSHRVDGMLVCCHYGQRQHFAGAWRSIDTHGPNGGEWGIADPAEAEVAAPDDPDVLAENVDTLAGHVEAAAPRRGGWHHDAYHLAVVAALVLTGLMILATVIG